MVFGRPGLSMSRLGMGVFALCSACSNAPSSDGAGAAGSGATSAAGAAGSGATSGSIFDDSQVPSCDSSKNYQLRGTLAGQRLAVLQFQATDLASHALTILVVVDSAVRTDLALDWSDPLAANKAIALTGTSLRVPDDQPLAGQSFCVTGGDFGSATPSDPSKGRTLLFRLTGMRQGDCSGMPVDSDLKGCIWRSPTALFPSSD